MGLFDRFKNQLIDIIEWEDQTHDTMVYKFDREDNEIKTGAKLIVRESQSAVFVDKGQFADVFTPGTYTLTTDNLPILSNLMGWKYGFDSPYKAEVYFCNTKRFTDMGWGTPNPIIMRDAEFGAIRVRAFGNYAIRIKDPKVFLSEIASTHEEFSTEDIEDQLRSFIISGFSDALAEARIPLLDLAAKYDELSDFCNKKITTKFHQYGLELLDFVVENISLPEEVEEMLDKKSSMNILGNNMNQFNQMQAGIALENASETEGGSGMSEGMGMGMGFGMASNMANNMFQQNQQQQPVGGQTPPPPPPQTMFHVIVNGAQAGPFALQQLQSMVAQNQLTRETMVWKDGMPQWTQAGNVSELSQLFGSTPPPPPPPMP
ncbi:SPFH domain-containing protein [Flammeovirga pacifica]|uniref:Antifreeze protein n=1 Tax=Flammeovirga pacifica TaxID=915059 RepID=A0A1S1YZQ1_FLAPC|nr:SPFH domain-containing protein [Flammeovirga pacifica]OHX66489.1 antifreeze protein [Flammeovirga pacifica]